VIIHDIKILNTYAYDIYLNRKSFEVRKNDRDYKVGDILRYQVVTKEGEPLKEHPLNGTVSEIAYILDDFPSGLQPGYVVLGIKDCPQPIYTHDEAAALIERFEDVLSKYDIHVPSPEDDEREPDNMVGLYGSTYSDLLDIIEYDVVNLLSKKTENTTIVPYVFSGNA